MFSVFDSDRAAGAVTRLAALLAIIQCVGCGPSTAPESADTRDTNNPAADDAASLLEQRLAAVLAEQSNQVVQLSARLDEFERREESHLRAAEAAQDEYRRLASEHQRQGVEHEEKVRAFLERIHQLEDQVKALQAGRVLPEITLTPDDGPTTQELDQKIRVVERKNELLAESLEAARKESPQFTLGQDGLRFESADGDFRIRVGTLVQADSRTFIHDDRLNEGNDAFTLRRARAIIEGTVFRDLDFQFVPDFGGNSAQILDANLTYRLAPELQLRAGKFKGPVGAEQLQEDSTLPFNERSMVSALTPSRSLGFQLQGEAGKGLVSYAAGVFNGTGDSRVSGNTDFGDDYEFAGRIGLRAFKDSSHDWLKNLQVGVGGSYSQVSSNALGLPSNTGGSLPGYTTPALQQFFAYNPVAGTVVADGAHWRVSPYLQYQWGPFGVLAEYIITRQGVYNSSTFRSADLEHSAWQVAAQWVLSGEDASFRGIQPRNPFRLHGGGWGAWQLVGRVGALDIDDTAFQGFSNPATSASGATSWSVGMNWWLNRNLRVLTSFTHTSFDGGGAAFNPADPSTVVAPATVTRKDENAVMTRLQLSY
jgi:phosphate-selective porin OprO/OprP